MCTIQRISYKDNSTADCLRTHKIIQYPSISQVHLNNTVCCVIDEKHVDLFWSIGLWQTNVGFKEKVRLWSYTPGNSISICIFLNVGAFWKSQWKVVDRVKGKPLRFLILHLYFFPYFLYQFSFSNFLNVLHFSLSFFVLFVSANPFDPRKCLSTKSTRSHIRIIIQT